MPGSPEIDRLIEEGLARYGSGDLDGALMVWEQVLALDPHHPQANSYVEYVRTNYETLSNGTPMQVRDPGSAPFAIQEEPEYQIEIVPGQLDPPGAPVQLDPLDTGWYIEEETRETTPLASRASEPMLPDPAPIELEADEPTGDHEFQGTTREYQRDFERAESPTTEFQHEESTGGFSAEGTPVGFRDQVTDVRQRELGFVQPAEVRVTVRTPAAPVPKPPVLPAAAPSSAPQAVKDKPSSPMSIGTAPTLDTDDLIASLPRPTAKPAAEPAAPPKSQPPGPTDPLPFGVNPAGKTQPMPMTPKAAAAAPKHDDDAGPPGIELPGSTKSPTLDLQIEPRRPAAPSSPPQNVQRLPIDPTAVSQAENLLQHAQTRDLEPLVGAPTRDLGLRNLAPPSEDAKTTEADVREFRRSRQMRAAVDPDDVAVAQTARSLPTVSKRTLQGGHDAAEQTHHDIPVAFDPIEARAQQILDEVDTDAPATESPEDRLRRRIGGLLDRALAWNGIGELDKAVAAVDLALSEDPNSALAQKLIHRNQNTVMTVFQSYLGPLDRQPQLAKPLHELASASISPRAAFLLSRIDGTLTTDEILDVSGMPRLEAYRYMCQLFLRGILK